MGVLEIVQMVLNRATHHKEKSVNCCSLVRRKIMLAENTSQVRFFRRPCLHPLHQGKFDIFPPKEQFSETYHSQTIIAVKEG